jgi:hypothetical protein
MPVSSAADSTRRRWVQQTLRVCYPQAGHARILRFPQYQQISGQFARSLRNGHPSGLPPPDTCGKGPETSSNLVARKVDWPRRGRAKDPASGEAAGALTVLGRDDTIVRLCAQVRRPERIRPRHRRRRRRSPTSRKGWSESYEQAYVPAEQPQAREDPWVPCPHGHPWWTRGHRCPSSQGPQGPERLNAVGRPRPAVTGCAPCAR